MITKIAAYAPDEWSFIVEMLEEKYIENIAKDYEGEDSDSFSALGLEKENHEERWVSCKNVLMRKATQEMWRKTSKEQINTLLKAMYDVKALSIKMLNGGDYTPNQMIEEWRRANDNI